MHYLRLLETVKVCFRRVFAGARVNTRSPAGANHGAAFQVRQANETMQLFATQVRQAKGVFCPDQPIPRQSVTALLYPECLTVAVYRIVQSV